MFRFLNLGWMRFLGVISYSFYLVHYSPIEAVRWYLPDAPRLLQAIVALALSVALSWTIYKLVETPLTALRKKLAVA